MGSKDYQIVTGLLTESERLKVLNWIDSIHHEDGNANIHLKKLGDQLRGSSYIFDISKTNLTGYISQFQSVSKVSHDSVPQFIIELRNKISELIGLPTDHTFLQAVDMNSGGEIGAHYDASIDGYINYKCNISILSDDYKFNIDKNSILVKEGDMYCFEASLFKHWTDKFVNRRVFLSFGFIVPYHITGRSEKDPRVRLSRRIAKYFQNVTI